MSLSHFSKITLPFAACTNPSQFCLCVARHTLRLWHFVAFVKDGVHIGPSRCHYCSMSRLHCTGLRWHLMDRIGSAGQRSSTFVALGDRSSSMEASACHICIYGCIYTHIRICSPCMDGHSPITRPADALAWPLHQTLTLGAKDSSPWLSVVPNKGSKRIRVY